MPAVSDRQYRLMQAARHGATFAKARRLRKSMSSAQLREWTASGPPSKRIARRAKRR